MPYFGPRANYVRIESTEDYLLIQDVGPWDQFKSVTNAAEMVVDELIDELHGRRLFYIDSEGQTDELVIENGAFKDFAPGGPS